MKANRLRWFLIFLLVGAALQSPAQQSEADRKLLVEVRAKAEKGDAQSQRELGVIFARGRLGMAKDEVEAVKWFRKAADQNLTEAQDDLGFCYETGRGVAQDYVEAVKWLRQAAEQNHALAQASLGFFYYKGQGVAQDHVEAVKWFRKAAEQNLAPAQYTLGFCYYNGQGVAQDYVEAVKWYRKAAEQNNAVGQYTLGYCYDNGLGVAKDYEEAKKWYVKAAKQGDTNAQNNLAWLIASTNEVPAHDDWTWEEINQIAHNPTRLEAIKAKAETGDAAAQYILGRLYDQYNDHTDATKWYRRAAVQGNAHAQYSLSWWYTVGLGVPRNYIEAYKWCDLAAAHSSDDIAGKTVKVSDRDYCRIQLSILEQRMTPEQISEAQRLAAAFVPRTETAGSHSNSPSPVAADSPVATGTGFFITADGYLISNYHVVKGAGKVRVLTSAGLIDAKLVQVDAANDLALLRADGRFAPLPIAASRTVALGGTVATVGFPDIGLQGFAPKLGKGEIASLSGAGDDPRYFQISVPVQPGNSGGALVDERGNVIGIVSAKLDAGVALAASGALPENVNYAVKSSLLLNFLESVPDVAAKLKEPNTKDRKFEDVVKAAEQAAVLVLVY